MNGTDPKWQTVERVANSLKVAASTIAKWKTRGVPGRWALRLIHASDGRLTVGDFVDPVVDEAPQADAA